MSQAAEAGGPAEFSHILKLDEISVIPQRIQRHANARECAALARRFDLQAIKTFAFDLKVQREGENVLLSGNITSDLVADCVATGAPVPIRIKEAIALRYVPVGTPGFDDELEIDSEDCDIAEYDGRLIDLGETAAQSLGLAIPPYPRSAEADKLLNEVGVLSDEEAAQEGSLGRLLKSSLAAAKKGEDK